MEGDAQGIPRYHRSTPEPSQWSALGSTVLTQARDGQKRASSGTFGHQSSPETRLATTPYADLPTGAALPALPSQRFAGWVVRKLDAHPSGVYLLTVSLLIVYNTLAVFDVGQVTRRAEKEVDC